MLIPERRERLSRYLALLLRHQGPRSGLRFDDRGFTPIGPLISFIAQNELFRWVAPEHIQDVVLGDAKGRYEIVGDAVRAKYGHSFSLREPSPPVQPPEKLFYGLPERRLGPAVQGGLRPFGRAMLHLSVDEQEAMQVAARQDPQPVLVEIDALGAHQAGVAFFKATEKIFLAASVPGTFLKPRR